MRETSGEKGREREGEREIEREREREREGEIKKWITEICIIIRYDLLSN